MTYQSKWLSVLTNLNANLKLCLNQPSNYSDEKLSSAIDQFVNFAHGHSSLLKQEAYNQDVIEMFNQILTNQQSSIELTNEQWQNQISNLIATIEETIPKVEDNKQMTVNIGTISGGNQQIGNSNKQEINDINIDLKTLINQVEKSDDSEAKSKLREFLNNNTVAGIIGASVPELFKIFGL